MIKPYCTLKSTVPYPNRAIPTAPFPYHAFTIPYRTFTVPYRTTPLAHCTFTVPLPDFTFIIPYLYHTVTFTIPYFTIPYLYHTVPLPYRTFTIPYRTFTVLYLIFQTFPCSIATLCTLLDNQIHSFMPLQDEECLICSVLPLVIGWFSFMDLIFFNWL